MPRPGRTAYRRDGRGLNFHPIDSKTQYGFSTVEIIRTDLTGSGFSVCDPGLPNKAIVTKVAFTVRDVSSGGAVEFCALFRNPLQASLANTYQKLAEVPSTGDRAFPGIVRLADTTISFATIDNTKYAYWLQCRINTKPYYDDELGIYGADVVYTINPANG